MLLYLTFILVIIYFLFLLVIIVNLPKNKIENNNDKELNEFISIIIPFKNENKNILSNLKSIENLDYDKDKYEVIYVDDNSDDNSLELLQKNINSYNIKVIKLKDKNESGKKNAVKYGIDKSKGSIIFTTDSDCIIPSYWLKNTAKKFDKETAFISGIVKFEESNNYWKKLQQLEFAGLVLVGGGLINAGFPTICNAANLAFRKSVFYEVGGYEGNIEHASGDDEFLMQKISKLKKYKIKFLFDKSTLVVTKANNTLKEFINQRTRWASKGLYYKNPFLTMFLIAIYLFFLSFPILFIYGLLINKVYLIYLFLIFIFKISLEVMILRLGKNVLFNKLNLFLVLISELLHVPYILFAGFYGTIGKYTWKNRKY